MAVCLCVGDGEEGMAHDVCKGTDLSLVPRRVRTRRAHRALCVILALCGVLRRVLRCLYCFQCVLKLPL